MKSRAGGIHPIHYDIQILITTAVADPGFPMGGAWISEPNFANSGDVAS